MCYNKFFSSEHTNIKISGKQSVLPDSESRKDRRTENALGRHKNPGRTSDPKRGMPFHGFLIYRISLPQKFPQFMIKSFHLHSPDFL